MPSVRFSRDKRGYEQIALLETAVGGRAPRAQVIYWYRGPAGVKVGRGPFDKEARRVLESEYPDIVFDWDKIVSTPPPAAVPDAQPWMERRRVSREAKAERAIERRASTVDEIPTTSAADAEPPGDIDDLRPESMGDDDLSDELSATLGEPNAVTSVAMPSSPGVGGANETPPVAQPPHRRHRRRRRRRGGGGSPPAPAEGGSA